MVAREPVVVRLKVLVPERKLPGTIPEDQKEKISPVDLNKEILVTTGVLLKFSEDQETLTFCSLGVQSPLPLVIVTMGVDWARDNEAKARTSNVPKTKYQRWIDINMGFILIGLIVAIKMSYKRRYPQIFEPKQNPSAGKGFHFRLFGSINPRITNYTWVPALPGQGPRKYRAP